MVVCSRFFPRFTPTRPAPRPPKTTSYCSIMIQRTPEKLESHPRRLLLNQFPPVLNSFINGRPSLHSVSSRDTLHRDMSIFRLVPILLVFPRITLGQQDLCQEHQHEGSEIRRGQTWFVCRRGLLYPSACSYFDSQLKSERRIEVGSSIWTNTTVLRCDSTGPNSAAVIPVGCVISGRVLPIGQTSSGRLFWYLCKKDENGGILRQQSGCVDQSGTLVQPNGVLIRGNFVYTCRSTSDSSKNYSVYLEPRGCSLNGQLYNLDDDAIGQGFWYKCQLKSSSSSNVSSIATIRLTSDDQTPLELKRTGCYQDGKKLRDGESFAVGQFAYKCDLSRGASSTISRTSSGCYARSSNGTYEQHPFGDRWLEGQGPVRIVMECKSSGPLNVSKGPVQCYYESEDKKEQAHMDSGCARFFPNSSAVVTCSIKDGKNVDSQIMTRATRDQLNFVKKLGFKEC